MTSSPLSHRARIVIPSAPNAPVVRAMSSGRNSIPVRERSVSATMRRGSASLNL